MFRPSTDSITRNDSLMTYSLHALSVSAGRLGLRCSPGLQFGQRSISDAISSGLQGPGTDATIHDALSRPTS